MRIMVATIAVLAIGSPAFAAPGCSHNGVENYIRSSEAEWAESVASGDVSVARKILAEDFVGVSPDGSVYDRSAALSEAAPGAFASNHLDYVHIHFHGDTAIVQGSERWIRKSGAKGHFVWIDTWTCSGGAWKIVSAADVNVPDKGP